MATDLHMMALRLRVVEQTSRNQMSALPGAGAGAPGVAVATPQHNNAPHGLLPQQQLQAAEAAQSGQLKKIADDDAARKSQAQQQNQLENKRLEEAKRLHDVDANELSDESEDEYTNLINRALEEHLNHNGVTIMPSGSKRIRAIPPGFSPWD